MDERRVDGPRVEWLLAWAIAKLTDGDTKFAGGLICQAMRELFGFSDDEIADRCSIAKLAQMTVDSGIAISELGKEVN